MHVNAVILGSAFDEPSLAGVPLHAVEVPTRAGPAVLHRVGDGPGWALVRHGLPHRYLPHQIPWRAQALALAEVGVGALLITSSVGVMDPTLPLFQPLLVSDLLMPDNRLPDGTACSVYPEPTPGQGHLVLDEGLCSVALGAQVRALAAAEGWPVAGEAVFAYVGGPRSKTRAENRWWAASGAQINSMSVGPELVLANELQIPTCAVGVGHKYSGAPGRSQPMDVPALKRSLVDARAATARLALAFVQRAEPVPFRNALYRYDGTPD
ncbi:MAG: 5'-methylthioadenosine phosphorylase [Myxococcales bacterium]|nr:5'-methylthioadenosine phosphorylase [Myxococcales bacterium]